MKSTPTLLSAKGSILTAGYVALDIIIDAGAIGHRAGGTAANVAALLSYFGWRAEVAATVGPDPAGQHLKADLSRAGVDTRHVNLSRGVATPVIIHEILDSGHRFRFGCPTCGRRFPRPTPLAPQLAERIAELASPDVFFFDRVSVGAIALARSIRRSGGLVVFEPATRGRAELFREAIELAHIVKFSQQRLPELAHLIPIPSSTHQLQVMTCGDQGAAWRAGRRWKQLPAYDTEVVDSGGAGDWTTAALLSSLPSLEPHDLDSFELDEILRSAQAVAAISCRVPGARGLSEVLTTKALRAQVAKLVSGGSRPRPPSKGTLRPSRRNAQCDACLAGLSG